MSWYTWVFDGLGTTTVIGGGTALYRKYIAKRQPAIMIAQASDSIAIAHPPERRSTEPTPSEISKEIKRALPFDRIHVGKKYVGVAVVWKVSFHSFDHWLDSRIENGVEVENRYWSFYCPFYYPDDGSYLHTGVIFNLKSVPPELKLLREGDIIWVKGKIKRVTEDGTIYLKNDPEIIETVRR